MEMLGWHGLAWPGAGAGAGDGKRKVDRFGLAWAARMLARNVDFLAQRATHWPICCHLRCTVPLSYQDDKARQLRNEPHKLLSALHCGLAGIG